MDSFSQQLLLSQLLKQNTESDDKTKYIIFFGILIITSIIIYFFSQSSNSIIEEKEEKDSQKNNTPPPASVGIGTTSGSIITPPPTNNTPPPPTNNLPFPKDQAIKSLLRPNYCLDATSDDKVIMWRCHGGDNQKWTLNDKQELKVKSKPDKCLDKISNSDDIIMYNCKDQANQKWSYDSNSKQFKQGDKCLDISYAFLSDGSKVQVYGCGSQTNQKFDANGGNSEDTSFIGLRHLFTGFLKYCASWGGSSIWCDRAQYGTETLYTIIKNNDYTYSIKNKDNKFCRTDENPGSRIVWCDYNEASNNNAKFDIIKYFGTNNYLIKNKESDKFCYTKTEGDQSNLSYKNIYCDGNEINQSKYQFQFQS